MKAMEFSGKITPQNIETYLRINQGIGQTIADVLTYNQIITLINKNIAFANSQREIIYSNQVHL
jgi:hypothetical protein